jgi:two-component system chemotaxis response regulator CheB
VVVQHVSPHHASYLADILSRRTALKVKQAEEEDQLSPSVIYIARPDWHLLVKPDGSLTLTQSEPLHFVRPSADLLFESLAKSYKTGAIAVVLTGTGVDGAGGIKAIKAMGGVVIAQDEATSEFFGMPSAAIQTGQVDYVLPLSKIAALLENLVTVGKIE